MSLLIDSTIKVSLIVLIALAAQWLLRRQSAAVRHWVMAVAIGCAVVTPVVSVIAPSWNLGLNSFPSSGNGASNSGVSTTTLVLDPSPGAAQLHRRRRASPPAPELPASWPGRSPPRQAS